MSAFWIRLKHNWFRNLLAVLQVAIAIAALSAVFLEVLPALKPDPAAATSNFTVRYGARTATSVRWGGVFLPEDVDYLAEHATTLEAVSTFDSTFSAIVVVDGDRYMLRSLARVNPSFVRMFDLEMVAGGFFVEQDVTAGPPRVAVISEDLADLLYGGASEALGKTINVRPDMEARALRGFAPAELRASALADPGDDVQVVGVFAPLKGTGIVGPVSPEGSVMFVPAGTRRPADMTVAVSEILVRTRPGMEQAAAEELDVLLTARLLERGHDERWEDGVKYGIMVDPSEGGSLARQSRLFGALIFGSLGFAALVVSSIAMFTTTLANLTQRTRYIGLSRALGATRGRIVREVVAETALLAGIGGAVGVVAAFPLRATLFAPLFNVLSEGGTGFGDVLLTGLGGVGLAVIIGGVAGLYPAWTIARLAPAAAWREERM